MRIRHRFLIFVILVCSLLNNSDFLFAQEYLFEHMSSNDGLSNNLIRDIVQDESGYLWLATSSGLNRFDGYSFEVYKTVMGDTLSLSDSRLHSIFEDKNGYMWTISSMGNCHRIDPVNKRVLNLKELRILPDGTRVNQYHIARNGDIWLLLNKGVLRLYYDNNLSSEFKSQYIQTNILPNNIVNFVYDDTENNIWIGTLGGAVKLKFNVDNTEEYQYELFFNNPSVSIQNVKEQNKRLYFGNNKSQLYVYDLGEESFKNDKVVQSHLRGNISTIQANAYNQLLFGSTLGEIILYNVRTNEYKYFSNEDRSYIAGHEISNIFADSYGEFWLITDKRGVCHFDPNSDSFNYFGLNYENRIFLGEPDKQILLEDSNNELWIGINGGGLFKFNRKQKSFQQFTHQPKSSVSISSDIILSLYEDKSKNLWIGTSYGGLNKISLEKKKMYKVNPVTYPKTGFDNYVRSVTTDVLGNIWIGTKAGKIYIYKEQKLIGTLPDDLFNTELLPATNVYSLYFDNNHNLWIGTKGYGIFVIKSLLSYINNLGSSRIEIIHFESDLNNPNTLSSNNVYSIKQDIYGKYWIGELGGMDLLSEPFTNPVFESFPTLNENPKGVISTEVRDLLFDNEQNLWIATSEGVSILESKYLLSKHKQFINISPSVKDVNSISGKVVYQIRQTQNSDILLAMLDGGINRLTAENFKKRNFVWEHFRSEILSPIIYSMEEDRVGNFWLGTDNGLYRYNIKEEIVERYQINKNILPLTFSENCSSTLQNGNMVFGSNDGFILFNPDSISKDTSQFPIIFSRLEINGAEINNKNSDIISTSIEYQKEITLSHNQNNLSLYFSVLDFKEPEAIQYSYFLEGYDNYWSKPSVTNSASYRKLPRGSYTLFVRGTNSSGTWIKEKAILKIKINPSFWGSVLGQILIIMIVSLLITVTSIIVYRQVVMQNRIRLDNAITEKRMEYYTNISHEFKTPLSLILNPVEEIISSHKSSDFARQKGMQIKRSAIYLKQLIEQILDFRKIREGRMQLKVSRLNVIEFFREIYLVFLPLSNKLGILFESEFNVEKYYGYLDIQQLEKIVYNLLSNAFRHTPKGKHICLIVNVDEINHQLEISVQDEGVGIDELELPKIFDRFYNSRNSSGIGLFYTREIVMLHKGTINVFNNKEKGATFVVTLPINEISYTESEISKSNQSLLSYDLTSINDIETLISSKPENSEVHHHVVQYMETILVVEDNPEMRTYLSRKLSVKYKIIEAENGEIGIRKAREYLPALILTDVKMPKVDGYEMTKILKSDFDTSHIPIVLLTSESSEEAKIKGINSGGDDYVVKPFNISYLTSKIDNIIALRKKLKERYGRDLKEENFENIEDEMKEQNFMENVKNLILQNLSNQQMNVEFLVENMQFSRTLFFKKIKASSGYAPNEFIRLIRMKESARLLLSTSKAISEISLMVGFNDSNYFSKTFKKHYGSTPSVYRSNKQNSSTM